MRLLTRFLWTLTRREKVGRLAQLKARCESLQRQRDNALEETWRLGRECNYQMETVALVRARLDGEAPQTDNPPAHGPYLVAVVDTVTMGRNMTADEIREQFKRKNGRFPTLKDMEFFTIDDLIPAAVSESGV